MTSRKTRIALLMRLMFPMFALSAIGLGMWGFLDDPTSFKSWHEATIKTLQIFLINVAPSEIHNIQTQIASLLAPAATIGAAFFAFSEGLRRNYWVLRLRFFPATNMFLGNGHTATAIASQHWIRNLVDGSGHLICNVGLDCRAETPLSQSEVVGSGTWFILQGDARSPVDLRRLNAGNAKNIWVLTGDDVRNLEIARRLSEICSKASQNWGFRDAKPRLLIAVNDREMIRVRHTLLGATNDLDLEFFSIPRLAARALLLQHPPRASGEVVSIAVIGSGRLAEAIVVQAATQLVYSELPSRCIRICLIGHQADALFEKVKRSFPALDPATEHDAAFSGLLPLAKISVHTCEANDMQPAQWLQMQAATPFSAIYVAGEDDLSTVGATIRVTALRDAAAFSGEQPIVACLTHDGSSSPIDFFPEIGSCYPFRLFEEFQKGETYPGEARDRRAKLVNYYYHTGEQGQSLDMKLMLRKADDIWRKASYEDRWSSRLSADHFDIKLTLIGLGAEALSTAEGRDRFEGMIPFLARLEHRRFLAERLLDGWLPYHGQQASTTPSQLNYKQQKAYLRLNKTLVPFDLLPEVEVIKDHEVIRAMVAFATADLLNPNQGGA